MLKLLPCLDSEDLAALRRRELDLPRARARSLGVAAVRAIETGHYFTEAGIQVDIGHLVAAAQNSRVSIPADAVLPSRHRPAFAETAVEVRNETTLGASRRLVEQGLRPLALNFANGVSPGGGILRVLAIAAAWGYESLVLGAWGCGAFANDPARTARDFRAAFEGPFLGAFRHVVFAITDWSPERRFLAPFRDAFAPS